MKKKPPIKTTTAPATNAIASESEQFPPGLEVLAQMKDLSPLQQMAAVFPKFAATQKTEKAKEAAEMFAGFFWGMGIDLGVPLPEWAKAASEKAVQALGFGFIRDLQSGQPAAFGKLVEIANLSPKNDNQTPLENTCWNLIQLIKTESGNLPGEEFGQYADGRKAAPKIIEKIKNPKGKERVLALGTIASSWREVEKLGSRTKTYKWLKACRTPQGELLLSPYTEWDEVKGWLAEINLPKGKAGRPTNKIRTPAKPANPVFP